jgi:hypothetical protein
VGRGFRRCGKSTFVILSEAKNLSLHWTEAEERFFASLRMTPKPRFSAAWSARANSFAGVNAVSLARNFTNKSSTVRFGEAIAVRELLPGNAPPVEESQPAKKLQN